MQENSPDGLKPAVIWGQHRTSEPLAVAIKDRLQADQAIRSSIVFQEHEKYQISDYTERLYRQQEAQQSGSTREQIIDMLRGHRAEVRQYDKDLRNRLGDLVFNFHDGYKRQGIDHDIEFWIPPVIKDEDILIQYLLELADRHGLTIKIRQYPTDGFMRPPESINVEFMVPNADEISSFPNEEVEQLAREFDPMDEGGKDFKNFIDYKQPDQNDPSYQAALEKYSKYMADVIKGLDQVRIS